jgi:DnaJ-class molecular chaperone
MYRKILGLGEHYTADELKAAYRDCAAKFHPDRYVNASERERLRAEEMMKNINEAYHGLS